MILHPVSAKINFLLYNFEYFRRKSVCFFIFVLAFGIIKAVVFAFCFPAFAGFKFVDEFLLAVGVLRFGILHIIEFVFKKAYMLVKFCRNQRGKFAWNRFPFVVEVKNCVFNFRKCKRCVIHKVALFVMLSARKNVQHIVGNLVNNSMLVIYSSGPVAGKFVFERLRFSDSFKRIAGNVFDEFFYVFEYFLVSFFPDVVVFVGSFVKSDYCNHNASSSIFLTLPFSISAIPSSRNFLFAGLLKRYSVSSMSVLVCDSDEPSKLSLTVISRTFPENIFFRLFRKSIVSSSFLTVNVPCILASAFIYNYTRIHRNFPYKNTFARGAFK